MGFAMWRQKVVRLVREKWEQYPVLAGHPAVSDIICVAQGEGIAVHEDKLPYFAQLVQYGGEWTILLDRDTTSNQRRYLLAHELGHLWLHHDPCAERSELLFTFLENDEHDPREKEADLFACLLLRRIPIEDPPHDYEDELRMIERGLQGSSSK